LGWIGLDWAGLGWIELNWGPSAGLLFPFHFASTLFYDQAANAGGIDLFA
jgi:hypothetical protein